MTHTGAPAIASEPVSIPNQSFFGWLRTQTALFVGQLLALIGAVGSIVALAYYVGGLHVPPDFLTPKAISTFVIYSHLVFLTIFIIWIIKSHQDNKRGLYRASRVYGRLVEDKFGNASLSEKEGKELADISEDQVRRFKLWFLFFWCAMLFLYIVFTAEIRYGAILHANRTEIYVKGEALVFPFLTFFANNVSMFFIFGCFVALYLPAGRKRAMQLSKVQAANDKEILDEHAEHRRRQAKLLWLFGIMLTFFTLAYPVIYWTRTLKLTIDNWSDYSAIFNALSGTLNAVVVALLIARLDSKLIGLSPWLISILYFYSGIQPMFVVFEQQVDEFDAIRAAVLVVVFIFKLYFFLIIFYSLHEGRLLNYFYCSPLLNQHVRGKQEGGIQASSPTSTQADVQLVQPPSPKQNKRRTLLDHWSEARLVAQPVYSKLRALLSRGSKVLPQRYKTQLHGLLRRLTSFGSRVLNRLHHSYLAGKEKLHKGLNWLSERLKDFAGRWQAEWPLMVTKLLGWVGIIYFVISLLYYAKIFCSRKYLPSRCPDEPWFFSPYLQELVIYAHFPLLLIIIVFLICVRWRLAVADANSTVASTTKLQGEVPPDVQSRLRQFQRFFLIFWCVMFVFYAVYAIKLTKHSSIADVPYRKLDVSSNHGSQALSSSNFIPLYATNIVFVPKLLATLSSAAALTHMPPPAENQSTQAQPQGDTLWIVGFSFITFVLNNLMVLFVFLCFSVLYFSVEERHANKKYKSARSYAILVFCLITLVTPLSLFSLDKDVTIANLAVATTVIAAVGGVLNAVAFALLFARLDSRLIRLPSSVISILYVYAALQPLFVVFERGTAVFSAIETSALLAAFIFKICFVLVIYQALRLGSIEHHLKNFPLLNNRVNSIFGNHYEIRVYRNEKEFKFSIFKKDAEIFRAEQPYGTPKNFDTAVVDLQKWMEDKDSYVRPDPVQGTYWVQIMKRTEEGTKTNEPLCESKDLSEDEVVDFIEECVDKVPYCKYSRV